MTKGKGIVRLEGVKALLAADPDFLRPVVQAVLQEFLGAEMTEALAAAEGERTPDRSATGAATVAAPWSPGLAGWS